jgi:hypothetical protein
MTQRLKSASAVSSEEFPPNVILYYRVEKTVGIQTGLGKIMILKKIFQGL